MQRPSADAEVQALFKRLALGEVVISSEQLLNHLAQKLSFRVVRDTVMTQEMPLSSKSVRRLKNGELVDILDGSLPEADAITGVRRVHCAARKDGAKGWATVLGTQGTVFLEPFGDLDRSS